MKEKDIIDFSKMNKNEYGDYIDENGEVIVCEICHLHDKAYEKFEEDRLWNIPVSHCPTCGCRMSSHPQSDENDSAVVSETNSYTSDGNIGYYPIFYCDKCDTTYALMPTPVIYNGNHDIFYTGGRKYVVDKEQNELVKSVASSCISDVEQFLSRKENEDSITTDNLKIWLKNSVEHKIASWLYNQGLKK